ncbi:MAG: Holliday junction branch migration protein RuvA [Alphaproteobacteria bacterium]
MISKLTGVIDSVDEDSAVVDVNGVGYQVFCSRRTLGKLPVRGGNTSVLVETTVREDRIVLYGFSDRLERDWYRLLTTVQGVGAKVALSILSALTPDEIAQAIAAQDKAMVSRADGVGPKLAMRLVNELKDRIADLASPVSVAAPAGAAARGGEAGGTGDAVSALVNLGYGRTEAFGAVARASAKLGADAKVEALVRAGLKELAS